MLNWISEWITTKQPCRKDVVQAQRRLINDAKLTSMWLYMGDMRVHVVCNESIDDDQPVYVCLHGTGSSSVTFYPFLQDLGNKPGLAIDLPCFGISDEFTGAHNKDAYIRAIHQVLEPVIKNRTIVWVGHSLGAVLASWCAIHKPLQTHSIVLLSPLGMGAFRTDMWGWSIKWGFPEKALTSTILSTALGHCTRMFASDPVHRFWGMFWCNKDRRNSYELLASYLCWDDKKKAYEWLYPYIAEVARMCQDRGITAHIFWGQLDPILIPPCSSNTTDKEIQDSIYPCVRHYVASGAGHNPLQDERVRGAIIIGVA
jgi:pimeloyl-ACP methyl ester carboxylesterase